MLFKLERKLREFANLHGLCFESHYHHVGWADSITYNFTNPRTNQCKSFRVCEAMLNYEADVEAKYMELTNYITVAGMVDRIKKPAWVDKAELVNLFSAPKPPEPTIKLDVDKLYPKQMFITTGRAGGKNAWAELLTEPFRKGYLDCPDNVKYFPPKFEVDPDDMQKVCDEMKEQWKRSVRNDVIDALRYSNKYVEHFKEEIMQKFKPTIEKVIFNRPATIVFWSDGTKTVVQAQDEAFDEEKGLAMAISKKFLGNQGNYFDEFKKWLPKIDAEPVKEESKYRRYVTVKEFAELSKVDISTVRKHCRMGLITGAIKQSGVWLIPIKSHEGKMEG